MDDEYQRFKKSIEPPLSYNEFNPPRSVPLGDRLCIFTTCIDVKTLHNAVVHSAMYRSSADRKNGFSRVAMPKDMREKDKQEMQEVLRYCTGSHSFEDNMTQSRISVYAYNKMCEYLGIGFVTAMAGPFAEVWDERTRAKYKVPLSKVRRRSSYA